jgi:hypothetical protein
MPARQSTKTMPCPACQGTSAHPLSPGAGAGSCPYCAGMGQVPGEFPFPYFYPINLTATQGSGADASQPQLVVPGAPANAFQSGTNPATLKLGNEGSFEWDFLLGSITSPDVNGDASQWIQLQMFDLSGTNWPFQAAPIFGNLFVGSGKLPFALLKPITFGLNTQLSLQAYLVNYSGNSLVIGVGNGVLITFTATLMAPILRGSLTVTAGAVTGADNSLGLITGANISGTVNYQTGAISVTFAAAPAANASVTAAWTQGCARVDAQIAMWGSYLKPFSAQEQQQLAASAKS